MEITVITNIDEDFRSRWEKFILDHPNGNFFQSPAAYGYFKSVDGYETVLIAAVDEKEIKGILSAVIIKESGLKGYFSRRCIVWGGPICAESLTAERLLVKLDQEISDKAIYTEFRNSFSMDEFDSYFLKASYSFEERINYIVKLESLEANRQKLNENRRRQIKKSLNSGAQIVSPTEMSEVKEFYLILKTLYKDKVKKPLPSFDFFEKFFLQKDLGKYLLVVYQGKIIGGIMCPVYRATIFEYYICGLDNQFRDQAPSVMATWAAIEYGLNNDLKYFDFMGAGKPDDEYGVRDFKSKFGGDEVRYGRYVRINNKLLFNIGKLGLRILKKL